MRSATVLIPSYLHPELPLRAADAAMQDCPDGLRVVIVDDGSPGRPWTDVTVPAGITVVQREENAGFAKCVNTGLEHVCDGDVVLLNSDVELSPGWLPMVQETAAPEHVGLVGIRLQYPSGLVQHAGGIPGTGGWFAHIGEGCMCSIPMTEVYGCTYVTGAFWYWKRETIELCGGLDEAYDMGVEDVDYCLRVWRAGKTVMYDGRAWGIHDCGRTRKLAGLQTRVEKRSNVRHLYGKFWPHVDLHI